MTDFCRHPRTIFIQGSEGTGGRDSVYICADCGEFKIFAQQGVQTFRLNFSLWSSAVLIAASQAYRRTRKELGEEKLASRVWKPLDFGHLRLYKVVLSWNMKDGQRGRNHFVVAADSPNQSPLSAANLVKKIYAESYDNNPQMSHWDVRGYALDVLQPLEWTENGIVLLNEEMLAEKESLEGQLRQARLDAVNAEGELLAHKSLVEEIERQRDRAEILLANLLEDSMQFLTAGNSYASQSYTAARKYMDEVQKVDRYERRLSGR